MTDLPPGTVVAMLRMPMLISGIEVTIRGIEKQYGRGLVVGENTVIRNNAEWFTISTRNYHDYVKPDVGRLCNVCRRSRADPIHVITGGAT